MYTNYYHDWKLLFDALNDGTSIVILRSIVTMRDKLKFFSVCVPIWKILPCRGHLNGISSQKLEWCIFRVDKECIRIQELTATRID